ncbi:MAG: hypothetical protein IPK00_10110 [Deltaproteobacteria bacterium]|nr:hypothetical protein [Deltaproteobacteria bacterium]
MNRVDLESWLYRNADSTRLSTHELIDRCEAEVRSHAEVIAWKHALRVAAATLRRFDGQFGLPASEIFVTREVCHEVARELSRHEPELGSIDETAWLSHAILDSIDPEDRRVFRVWVRQIAEREEHRIWHEVVVFTHHVARALIEKAHLTGELDWTFERTYPKVATRVMQLLLREYAAHLRESRKERAAQAALH